MQKVYLFLVFLLHSFIGFAQLPVNENFSGYTNGDLGDQGSWVTSGGGSQHVQVTDVGPSLSYVNYGSGARYITVSSENGRDPQLPFEGGNVSTASGRIFFMSFIVRVSYAPLATDNPEYSIILRNSANNFNDAPLRFYIRKDPNPSNTIEFGVGSGDDDDAGSAGDAVAYTAANFQYGTNYLIVIRYDVITGTTDNDDAYLWVNPSLTSEPSTATATGATGATQLNSSEESFGGLLNTLQIFQSNNTDSPDAAYDGLRVSHGANSALAWGNLSPAQATLPVDLKSFKAVKDNNTVKITWEVGTENNVLKYEVQRSKDGNHFEPIGFVDAAAQPNYAYVDNRPMAGTNFYRIVTIDNDRRLKYTSIVSVNGRKDLHIFRFPNPTTNTLLVQHQEVSSGDATLRVTSFDGKLVKALRLAVNSVQTNIDVSTLRAGNYVVEFVNGGQRISTTFIKL